MRVDHRRARRCRLPRRRRRWPGELHRRPGRRDRVRPLGQDSGRSTSRRRVPYGGGGSMGVLLHAASAVASGAADVVVAYRADSRAVGRDRASAAAKTAPSPTSAHSGTTATQWCMPFGVLTPASWMALNSVRYMHDYGVKSADIGRAVVQLACLRGDQSRGVGLSEPDHARGSPELALDRRAVHPPASTAARRPTVRSRWSSRAASVRPICRTRRCSSAAAVERRPVRTGDRRPTTTAPISP